jgi:flagellar assembly factor FliW
MKIKNQQFGEIEFNKNSVLKFENGLFGFEELKEFVLIKTEEEIFHWLCSVNEPEIVFPLFLLKAIDKDYPADEKNEAFGVVTLNSDPAKISINMKAPVYIDSQLKQGRQVILDNSKYPVKHNLFVEE